MKIGIVTNAYIEPTLIQGCVKQFWGMWDWDEVHFEHLVLCPTKPWQGDYKDEQAQKKTADWANWLGAKVIWGDWPSAHEQLNFGVEYFSDADWVLIVDADERYEQRMTGKLIEFLKGTNYDIVRSNMWEVYWKDTNYVIDPPQDDFPFIAVRPHIRFDNIRHPVGDYDYAPVMMHHLSYVRNDQEMLKKVMSFEAAKEFHPVVWYNTKWKNWNETVEDLHPVNPPQFRRAVYMPAPLEIKRLT